MSENSIQDRYYDVNEAAEYLHVCTNTVYRACECGRMKALKFGRNWRIKREWMDNFLIDVQKGSYGSPRGPRLSG